MKITFQEFAGCFSFDLIAESIPDAALLARAAMNTKNVTTSFSREGAVTASVVFQKPRENRRAEHLSRPNLNRKP